MFKLISSNTGRTVYMGSIVDAKDTNRGPAIRLAGTEYNKDAGVNMPAEVQALVTPEAAKAQYKINDTVAVTVLPSKDSPLVGTAEEIIVPGTVTEITNQNNNVKTIIYGRVSGVRWNNAHNVFTVSFRNLKNASTGAMYGTEGKPGQDGQVPYWVNVAFFGVSDGYSNYYPADKAEREIGKGDLVVIVAGKKITTTDDGRTFINYNNNKYVVIEKVTAAPAAPQTVQPNAVPANALFTDPLPQQVVQSQAVAQPTAPVQQTPVQNVQSAPQQAVQPQTVVQPTAPVQQATPQAPTPQAPVQNVQPAPQQTVQPQTVVQPTAPVQQATPQAPTPQAPVQNVQQAQPTTPVQQAPQPQQNVQVQPVAGNWDTEGVTLPWGAN